MPNDAEARALRDPLIERPLIERLRTGLAAAGLAGLVSLATGAEAQDFQLFGQGGTYIGYTWGGPNGGGVTWGFEGRVGGELRDPWRNAMDPFFAAAAVARFGFIGIEPGLHLGGQAGAANGWGSLMGEVLLGYQWGEGGGFSMPLGVQLDVAFASTFIRADPFLESFGFGGGVVLPPRMFMPMAVAGRALHDEVGHAALPAVERLDEPRLPADVGAELATALCTSWERRAQAEWASVPAFVQLAEQLRVADAPVGLIDRALDAAQDELRHAVMTARASMCYGGAPLRLGRVTPATRAHAQGRDALARLAVESWIDGCLGEGKAAAAVACEADLAPASELAAMQRAIAADEARHAELAWDVLAWALAAGGDDVRHALAAVRDARPSDATSGVDSQVDLRPHGLLSEAEHGAIGDVVRERALPRFDRLVA